MQPAPERRQHAKGLLRECLEALVLALVVTLFLRTFVLQAFQIPSASMEPSLLVGDRLFVDKLAYSRSCAPFEDALLRKPALARGDLVVFKAPADPARNFVKRVVGLPDDNVELRGGRVYVDGRPLDEPYARGPRADPAEPPDHGAHGFSPEQALADWGPARVPQQQLFVLGDNRSRSSDSRSWGFVPRDRVEGQALLIYWSSGPQPAATGRGLCWRRLPPTRWGVGEGG